MPIKKPLIPQSAELVFKGKVIEVYQWEVIDADGKIQRWEKAKKKHAVAIIPVLKDGSILLIDEIRHDGEVVSLPTGGVNRGEEPLEGAKRELLEETGYLSDDWELWFEFQKDKFIESLTYVYVARSCQKSHSNKLGVEGERIKLKQVSFEDFLKLASNQNFRNEYVIPKILRARLEDDEMAKLKNILSVSKI